MSAMKTPQEWAHYIKYSCNPTHLPKVIQTIQFEARQKALTEAKDIADGFLTKINGQCILCAELIGEAIGYLRDKFP